MFSLGKAELRDKRIIFVDIDTQIDFMHPKGKLYLEESRHIIANLECLLQYALLNRVMILQTADTHVGQDPEFEEYGFPPHCVAGTPGWHRIPETNLRPDLVIPNKSDFVLPTLNKERIILVEKPAFSIASNMHAVSLLQALQPCHFVVFGVATEGCVRQTVLSLLSLKCGVSVVIDAVAPGRVKTGEQTLEDFTSLGVQPLTTEDICSGILWPHRLGTHLVH